MKRRSPRLLLCAVLCASPLSAQTIVNSFPVTGFSSGLEYDPVSDTIWVIDGTADTINQYDRAGTFLTSFAAPIPPGSGAGQPIPIGLGIDPTTGNIWVGDENEYVYEITPTGTTTGVSWSTQPNIVDVSGVDVNPVTGHVYISQDSNGEVVGEFMQDGTWVQNIDLVGAGSTDPDGLGYDPASTNFFLGEDIPNLILEVDQLGTLLNTWDVGALGISPEGLGVDSAGGKLFVSDGVSSTVYELDGIVIGGGGPPRLSVTGLTAGNQATITVRSATPSANVIVAYSLTGGGPIPYNAGPCGMLTVELSNPVTLLPAVVADPSGIATLMANVPPGTTGLNVWIQGFDVATCTLSNGLHEIIL